MTPTTDRLTMPGEMEGNVSESGTTLTATDSGDDERGSETKVLVLGKCV